MSLPAITPTGTYEVRLHEPRPYPYVVATEREILGTEVDKVARALMATTAVDHANTWTACGFPLYVAANYQVKVFDVTGEWPVQVAFQL